MPRKLLYKQSKTDETKTKEEGWGRRGDQGESIERVVKTYCCGIETSSPGGLWWGRGPSMLASRCRGSIVPPSMRTIYIVSIKFLHSFLLSLPLSSVMFSYLSSQYLLALDGIPILCGERIKPVVFGIFIKECSPVDLTTPVLL